MLNFKLFLFFFENIMSVSPIPVLLLGFSREIERFNRYPLFFYFYLRVKKIINSVA